MITFLLIRGGRGGSRAVIFGTCCWSLEGAWYATCSLHYNLLFPPLDIESFSFRIWICVSQSLLGSGSSVANLGDRLHSFRLLAFRGSFGLLHHAAWAAPVFHFVFGVVGLIRSWREREGGVERHGHSMVFYHLGGPWADLKLYWISPRLIPVRAPLT